MNNAISQEDNNQSPAWRAWAEALFILGVFFVAAGDPLPAVNEPHYLCRCKHFWDPSWCQGDLFLESPDAQLTLVVLTGWLTKFVSLSTFAWGGRLLAWSLLALAWWRLSWRVCPAPWLSVLTAALWLTGMRQLHLAGEWAVGGVEAKCLAFALVLFALRDYLDDKWNRVWVQLGLASALHVLVGGWPVVVLFAVWAVFHRGERSFISQLPGLLVGGLLATAGVLPPLLMNAGVDPELASQANVIYVFQRLPHHLALLSMKPEWLANRAARHALLVALLAACSIGLALYRRNNPASAPNTTDATLRVIRFAWGSLVLSVIGFGIEWSLPDNQALAAGLLRFYWWRLADFAAPLGVAMALGLLLCGGVRGQRAWAPVLLLLLLAAPVWDLGTTLQNRMENPIPPADRKMPNHGDWVDVCQWVAENTPEDAVLLTPRDAHTFKWRTGRGEVATWKDIPQNAEHMVAWRNRLHDIYPRRVKSLTELGAARLRAICQEYDAQYVLTTHAKPISLPVVYRNGTYVVYEVR